MAGPLEITVDSDPKQTTLLVLAEYAGIGVTIDFIDEQEISTLEDICSWAVSLRFGTSLQPPEKLLEYLIENDRVPLYLARELGILD